MRFDELPPLAQLIDLTLGAGWDYESAHDQIVTEEDSERFVEAMRELEEELRRRGWVRS